MYQVNDEVEGQFYVTEEALLNSVKGPYLRFKVRNIYFTGGAVLWDAEDAIKNKIVYSQKFVSIKGKVESYKDIISLKITEIKIIEDEGEIEIGQIIPSLSNGRKHNNFYDLEDYLGSICDENLRFLCLDAFSAIPDLKERLMNSPAATKNHHAISGGLLEHTLSMIKMCVAIRKQYPYLSEDLLIAGCFWHDLGKIGEIEGILDPKYSIEGNLLGHMGIAQKYLEETITFMERICRFGIDRPRFDLIRHIIYSHHGKMEWGSQVVPLFPEAYVIHMSDMLDASLYVFFEFLKNGQTNELIDASSSPVVPGRKILKHKFFNKVQADYYSNLD